MPGDVVAPIRVNVQLPRALKQELERLARQRGESLSAFLREGARERLERLLREERKKALVEAYQAMAEENRSIAAEFELIDLEGWEP